MSYILDALRRAQAERERGRLPGLQSQPLAPPQASPADATRQRTLAAAAAGLLLVVAAAAVWWWLAPVPAAPRVAEATVPQLPPAATEATGAAAAPPPPAPAAALPLVVSAPTPPPAPPPVLPPPTAEAAPAPAVAVAAAASPPAAASASPTPLAALAPALRRQLPPLEVGGSVWSENPASRFVIINGQLVHEGQSAAPGVVVERIAQRFAVLRWRELRIELPL